MATSEQVYDLVRDCNETESAYVRERLANPDDELEEALASMTAEEVVQYLKDDFWASQEDPASVEQENADITAHLAAEEKKKTEDADAEVTALLRRLRK